MTRDRCGLSSPQSAAAAGWFLLRFLAVDGEEGMDDDIPPPDAATARL